jgi:hypothetical protein
MTDDLFYEFHETNDHDLIWLVIRLYDKRWIVGLMLKPISSEAYLLRLITGSIRFRLLY